VLDALSKVLRQMLTEYQASDFGVRFVTRQDEPPALGWRQSRDRLTE
jgi:hypothetical protein